MIEHFGSAEVWALKLTPEWVGTDGKSDLPLPDDVRRYYIASSTHGGGAGGFDSSLPGVGLPKSGPQCPGNNFGIGVLPANPVPHTQTVNALRVHFRDWVMKGTPPPPSRFPELADATLARADKASIGFPTLPGLRASVPEGDFIMPVLDYDWGPQFNAQDGSGIAIDRAAAHQAGADDVRTQGRRRRQRARRRAGGAARRAAGHLPRLEHHRSAARCRSTRTRSATTSAA